MNEDDEQEWLDRFFSLKHEYETQAKNEPLLCIQCKKPGGTLFTQKKNVYSAICKATPPCDLRLKRTRGFYLPGWDVFYTYRDIMERSKQTMQMLKNDVEFQYLTETVAIKSKFEEENTHYEATLKMSNELYNVLVNPAREKEIREKKRELESILNDMDILLDECKMLTDGSISNIVEKQIQALEPLVTSLRTSKYDVIEMNVVTATDENNRSNHCRTSSSSYATEKTKHHTMYLRGDNWVGAPYHPVLIQS